MVDVTVPKTQVAAVLSGKGVLEIKDDFPVPQPGSGQVLIKVEAAPLNPSDTYFMEGDYDLGTRPISYPVAPGWEGAGTVVATGGGISTWGMIGRRVAFSKQSEPNQTISIGGSYQQYAMTDAW